MGEQTRTVFEVQSFWAGYKNQKVIRDVNLSIPATGITAIIGPSGCGKTTLLNSLNRISELKPDFCSGGSIQFRGRDIHDRKMDVVELRKSVGLIFQKPNPFPLSVAANLEIPLQEQYHLQADELQTRVNEKLSTVGLLDEIGDPGKSLADELSGGQQQRLCIARTLTLDPEVLLCDEPCSSLDPISGDRVEKVLLDLAKSISVVIVTHNLFQAKRMADHVLFFCVQEGVGRLIEQGPTEEIFSHPKHELTQKYLAGIVG